MSTKQVQDLTTGWIPVNQRSLQWCRQHRHNTSRLIIPAQTENYKIISSIQQHSKVEYNGHITGHDSMRRTATVTE